MKSRRTGNGSILVIGIGNDGRQDDGLGWRFAEQVTALKNEEVDCEFRYQLQVEDVLPVCRYSKVFFVDATQENLPQGYEIKPCLPARHYFFSSHVQTPETILYLANELYSRQPEAYTIAISGEKWGVGMKLSEAASGNMQQALAGFTSSYLSHKPDSGEKQSTGEYKSYHTRL